MKKILALLLISTMIIGLATGCGKGKETSKSGEAAKTGFAVISSLEKSKDASAEGDGTAQTDSLVVAVLVGKDGKILDCKIDAAQTQITFSAEGKLTTDIATIFKSKQEKGTEYGMKGQSGIGKEWNEQADAFADYVIGKTADEVKGIAVSAEGVPTDADLTASVTIHVSDMIAGVEKAVANAQELGAASGDKLGIGVTTDMSKSKDASAEGDGLAQAYSNYAALTVNGDGKITSCFIDGSQGNVNFSTAGAITSDLTAAPQTKQELKEGYNMKGQSGIGKEWYEQANAFAKYVTGKTLEEVKGIALTEGVPSDADLAASVTVHVNAFITNIEKAVTNAK